MKQKIIIIGAGFAGIQLVRKLDADFFDVLLIDKINHHQFQPLFYQVATSQIEPSSISFPVRNIFKSRSNVQVRLAEVFAVDEKQNCIHSNIGTFTYDVLVLAMGCKTNFFGNSQIEDNAFTLKSTADAIRLRNHVLQTFEDIVSAPAAERELLMNLVIVGAGPTGVELAGAFAEIKKYILPKDYPGIDFSQFSITLIEGSAHTLNSMGEKSKAASEKYLRKMGVNVLSQTVVKNYDGHTLTLNNGTEIKTKTVIWSAGVIANTINGLPEACKARGNRVYVDRYNKIKDCTNIFAIGDVCLMETPLYPKGHPQVANVAINQAKNLAKNLKNLRLGKLLKEYEYKDLGSMATIGKNKAVVDVGKLHLKGYFAWLIWMFLHLMLILSVKNKLIIFINWAWAYISNDSSLRLILKPAEKKPVADK